MTLETIRQDLKEIRYYFGMIDLFNTGSKLIPPKEIVEKVNKYNSAVSHAPARLYALYVGLYVNNNTQAVLADDWGFSTEHIKRLNNKLCYFLRDFFEKQNH